MNRQIHTLYPVSLCAPHVVASASREPSMLDATADPTDLSPWLTLGRLMAGAPYTLDLYNDLVDYFPPSRCVSAQPVPLHWHSTSQAHGRVVRLSSSFEIRSCHARSIIIPTL
jgi:hypothetical protein